MEDDFVVFVDINACKCFGEIGSKRFDEFGYVVGGPYLNRVVIIAEVEWPRNEY